MSLRLLIPAGELKIGMVIDDPGYAGALDAIYQLVRMTVNPKSEIDTMLDGRWVVTYVAGKAQFYRVERLVHVRPEPFEF